jgi:hypothetical protein
MNRRNSALGRLLRSAAEVPEEQAAPPFGFETRVVALWREGHHAADGSGNGILRLVRRVTLAATLVILLSSTASFRELRKTADAIEPSENEFAIADSAIQNEFYQ